MSLLSVLFHSREKALAAIGSRCFEGGIYRHYEGGTRTTLHLAIEEATGREVVVYEDEKGKVRTCLPDSFFSVKGMDGGYLPKLKFIKRAEDTTDSNLAGIGVYQHYKGGVYTALYLAIDDDTGREVVIYRGDDRRVWSRPSDSFYSVLADNDKYISRFELLKN